MYLEDKLDQLVLTVDRLIVVTEQLLEQQSSGAPAPKQDVQYPQPEQKAPEQVTTTSHTPQYTHITKDSLQDYALSRVRDEGKAFKATLIDALGKYGVKTISQLPDDEAAKAVYAVIGGGK